MSIPMNNTCVRCFMEKRLRQINALAPEAEATEMGKKILQMYAQSPADMDSALLGGLVDAKFASGWALIRIGSKRKRKCPTGL